MSTALSNLELIASLQNEVRILLHLVSKVRPEDVNYRPGEKQRSILELLQYLTIMGPHIVPGIKAGAFDGAAWGEATATAATLSFDEVRTALEKQHDGYAEMLGGFSGEDLRAEMEMFGRKDSKGSLIVNLVFAGHAAYRTQLFLNLKACGQDSLNTYNLWAGVDGTM